MLSAKSLNLILPITFGINDLRLQILEAFHHPYYATGRSDIQREMYDTMERWFSGLEDEAEETLRALTKVCILLSYETS